MGEPKFCQAIGCNNSLPPRHSRYCRTHSPFASTLWKRQLRARLRCEGISPHLDHSERKRARSRKRGSRIMSIAACCAAGIARLPDQLSATRRNGAGN